MRRSIAVAGLLSASLIAGRAEAQIVPGYVQYAAPQVYYAVPTRPAYPAVVQPVPQYWAQTTRPTNPTGYQNRPYYGAYGYGNYSNGSTDGYPPFRGRRWR